MHMYINTNMYIHVYMCVYTVNDGTLISIGYDAVKPSKLP